MRPQAAINGEIATVLKTTELTLGMGNPQGRIEMRLEEDELFIVERSKVGDRIGITAQLADAVEVVDLDNANELLFSGTIVTRKKEFINQSSAPFQVSVTAVDHAWRLANPPAYLTKAYQSSSQTETTIVEDALEVTGLDLLGFSAGGVRALTTVPPIVFENANLTEVLDELAELAGADWYVQPDKTIALTLPKFFTVAPFEVREEV